MIAGSVCAVLSGAPVEGRVVEVRTGCRAWAVSGPAGHFSFWLEPGLYQLSLELAEDERLLEAPEPIALHTSDLVSGIELVLAGAGVAGHS